MSFTKTSEHAASKEIESSSGELNSEEEGKDRGHDNVHDITEKYNILCISSKSNWADMILWNFVKEKQREFYCGTYTYKFSYWGATRFGSSIFCLAYGLP